MVRFDQQISCVTRYMDRFSFLKRSLPVWLNFDYYEIIIVDWSSKEEDIVPYVKSFNDSRIKIIRVHDQQYFNQGASWNVGIRYASSKFINGIDCDTILKPQAFSKIVLDEKKYCTGFQGNHTYGTVILPKFAWATVGGYTEIFKTWSRDDVLFYNDLSNMGYDHVYFLENQIESIEHDDIIRFKNHELKFSQSDAIDFNKKEIIKNADKLKDMKKYKVSIYEWHINEFVCKTSII